MVEAVFMRLFDRCMIFVFIYVFFLDVLHMIVGRRKNKIKIMHQSRSLSKRYVYIKPLVLFKLSYFEIEKFIVYVYFHFPIIK